MYRISILGTGYVGLSTAVCFASRGYDVITSTYSKDKIELINRGIPPFYEPQLREMLEAAVKAGRLRAVYGREEAVHGSDVSFITVGTPSRPDGSIDLRFIEAAAKEIGEALGSKKEYHLVVAKSTIVPGTTEGVIKPLIEAASGKCAGADFGLAMSPEFLRQGASIHDTLNPDRIIIGELDRRSGDLLEDLFRGFYGEETPPVLRMYLTSAEMIKYANNAFLATKVSFINEMANICERIGGVDVDLVARGIGLDERIAPRFLEAGPGWGGSCFPKDVKALIALSRQLDFEPTLMEAVVKVNLKQAEHAVETVKKELGGLEGRTVAILGLSFKPETDDTRESPAFKIIDGLLKGGARVRAYDPQAIKNTRRRYGDRIYYAGDAPDCLSDADCAVLVTHWMEFKGLEPETFRERMRRPILIDTRRLYDREAYSKALTYRAVGIG
ncbi:MAG: UDP-glucose dehydrogenase family protein [Candidatus Bathyarchaeia archaeon]